MPYVDRFYLETLLTINIDDPYAYDLPFQSDQSTDLRPPRGFVGVRNLSNTCYLSSLLTQLFMNTEFRRFILRATPPDAEENESLLFRTQQLFAFMQESYRQYVDPELLVKAIKTYEDTPIDVTIQMDVDEFYNLLFGQWESQFTDPKLKEQLRSFYEGQIVQQIKSKECEHVSERTEPFSAIQCEIKGKSCLQESLQAYVDGEVLEGGMIDTFNTPRQYVTQLTLVK